MIVRVCLFLGGAGSSTVAMGCAAAVGRPGKPAIRFKGMDRGVGKAFGRSGTGRIRSEIGGSRVSENVWIPYRWKSSISSGAIATLN